MVAAPLAGTLRSIVVIKLPCASLAALAAAVTLARVFQLVAGPKGAVNPSSRCGVTFRLAPVGLATWCGRTGGPARLPSAPSASRAAACSTVNARAQVPLRDQRRTCEQTRVQGPNDSGR